MTDCAGCNYPQPREWCWAARNDCPSGFPPRESGYGSASIPMPSASDVYIWAQVESALIEVDSTLRDGLASDVSNVARRLISALDDRDIELRPR